MVSKYARESSDIIGAGERRRENKIERSGEGRAGGGAQGPDPRAIGSIPYHRVNTKLIHSRYTVNTPSSAVGKCTRRGWLGVDGAYVPLADLRACAIVHNVSFLCRRTGKKHELQGRLVQAYLDNVPKSPSAVSHSLVPAPVASHLPT